MTENTRLFSKAVMPTQTRSLQRNLIDLHPLWPSVPSDFRTLIDHKGVKRLPGYAVTSHLLLCPVTWASSPIKCLLLMFIYLICYSLFLVDLWFCVYSWSQPFVVYASQVVISLFVAPCLLILFFHEQKFLILTQPNSSIFLMVSAFSQPNVRKILAHVCYKSIVFTFEKFF